MGVAEAEIIIEDFDLRCEEKFPDSGERCWCMAVKIVKFRGHKKRICLAHYEQWLASLASVKKKAK